MSKRNNESFISTYIELDKLCCTKFGVSAGGVTEYINRLNNARYAPGRDDVLPQLIKYRNKRNKFAHEPRSVRSDDDIGKEDLKWVARFKHDVQKRRDPISKYLKKARRYARRRRLRRFLIIALIIAAIVGAVAAYLVLK